MFQHNKPLFLPFIFFLRGLWLLFLGSAIENQLLFLHGMTHTGKHAYRFAVFVCLQRAHHWAAFLLESNLSASAHFHSLLCRRKKNSPQRVNNSLFFSFFFFNMQLLLDTLSYNCPAIIWVSLFSLPGWIESGDNISTIHISVRHTFEYLQKLTNLIGESPKEQLLPTTHLSLLHCVVQNQLKLLFRFCLRWHSDALFINDHQTL